MSGMWRLVAVSSLLLLPCRAGLLYNSTRLQEPGQDYRSGIRDVPSPPWYRSTRGRAVQGPQSSGVKQRVTRFTVGRPAATRPLGNKVPVQTAERSRTNSRDNFLLAGAFKAKQPVVPVVPKVRDPLTGFILLEFLRDLFTSPSSSPPVLTRPWGWRQEDSCYQEACEPGGCQCCNCSDCWAC